MRIIQTEKAPKAIGPYSQAVECNGFIFVSGQIGIDPETGRIVEGGIEEETARALMNIESILTEGGSGLERVVKTTVYLLDLNDFLTMNQIYEKRFKEFKPARTTVQVAKLPLGARVEIDAIAKTGE